MIISLDSENVFDQTQHPFMIKVLERLDIQGTIPQHNRGNLQQTHNQHQHKHREIQSIH